MKRLIFLSGLVVSLSAGAVAPLWIRDAKISPDGKTIAFTYKGDIWTVATEGGQATRLTATDDYETTPVWSPDSRSIAFAGDRAGNFDIYVIDAKGGAPRRLTYNSASETPEAFTPDGKAVVFSASIMDPAESALFPTSRMTELYKVGVADGALTQLLATPARYVSWQPDGESFLYQDVKGFEDEWRKHHTSSVTRDIWLYDAKSGRHTNLTARGGEDTNPVVGRDGIFYFLSERDGKTVNVYEASTANAADAKALTSFATHPVRFLSRAESGTLAITYDGEIYTLTPGSKPSKVTIELTDPDVNIVEKAGVRSGARQAVPSPDGKSIAFIYRGDVFVTPVDYSTTKQITSTPEAESGVSWSPDGKTLIYTSERDGRANIYRATVEREESEPNFANATIIKEERLFKADSHERGGAEISPDGKKLAFILDRTKLAVMDLDSKKVKLLTDGTTNPQRNGTFGFSWSPDSKWIVLEIVDRRHEPYSDIAIINVDSGEMTNLTNSGYFDERPRWNHDGTAITFQSERYGMRNHASWGSQGDVMAVFLTRDAYDRFRLSEEDYALQKEIEKDNKKDDKEKADSNDSKDIVIELDGIDRRVVRLTPMSADLSDHIVTADGESL